MAAEPHPSLEDLVCHLLETSAMQRLDRLVELCSQFPAQAPGLRDHYEWLAANGLLSAETGAAATDHAAVPERLGQYQVHGSSAAAVWASSTSAASRRSAMVRWRSR